MTNYGGPLGPSLNRLSAGHDSTWQITGASTTWGLFDAQQSTQFGWVGRLAIGVGALLNVNVKLYLWNYPTGIYGNAYEPPVTIYSSTLGGSAPTLTVWLGALPGATWGTIDIYIGYYQTLLVTATADVVICSETLNEDTPLTTFIANYTTAVNHFQTKWPGVPVIVCDENATTTLFESAHHVSFADILAALLGWLLPGQSAPVTPALQTTSVGGVWFLDTQQAFAPKVAAGTLADYLYGDGQHPNSSGYALQAAWMLAELTVVAASTVGAGSAVITTAMGTATGISPGKGGLVLPANWRAGDEFTAQDENNVAGTLNALIAAIATLGYSLPPVASGWITGSLLTADDESAVVTAINSLNAVVSGLGGPALSDVPVTGPAWSAENENIVETAINELHAAVTTLTGAG